MSKFQYAIFFFMLIQNLNISYAQLFNQPESVTYDDIHNRYLVSNRGTGIITQMSDTDTSLTTLQGNLGLIVKDSTLFTVLDSGEIKGYNLKTEEEVFSITIAGAQLLNDLVFDTSGFLYVTEYNGHKIYKVNIKTSESSVFVTSGITNPNGILFDEENNRLIFCESFSGRIKGVNLEDSSVSTIVQNTFLGMDGMTVDNEGNIYVSNWQNHSVYKFDKDFNLPPVLVSSGFNGPADIFYNKKTNTLAVPSYNQNLVRFIQIPVTTVENDGQQTTLTFHIHQNFPNPFNPTTEIRYQTSEVSNVSLKVYDAIGRDVITLVNEGKAAGRYGVTFDASKLSSGIYFCRMTSGGIARTIKMALHK